MDEEALPGVREPLRALVTFRMREDRSQSAHRQRFRIKRPCLFRHVAAQMQQHLGDVDLYRADLVAGAAQSGGVGERCGTPQAEELGSQDRADGARIDRAIRVAASTGIDGTDVQAGATANAMERLPPYLVSKHVRSSIIEQDEMKCSGAIARRHSGPQAGVGVHPLAGRAPRQQLEEDLKVTKRRDNLLDPHYGDKRVRQGQAHPPVPLTFDDRNCPRLRDRKVGAADGHLS